MALFNKEQVNEKVATTQPDAGPAAPIEGQSDEAFYASLAGEGLGTLTDDTVSTAYLAMVQPGSTAEGNGNKAGSWINSATQENFGETVEVVVVAHETVWVERDSQPPYMTVGRYEPRSIEVGIEQPKPGTRGFPTMKNKETGNKVEELFMYAVVLPAHPEAGLLYFSPTTGSMRTCKQWNSMLRSQRLPNGQIASIYAYTWLLTLEQFLPKGQVDVANNYKCRLGNARRGTIITPQLALTNVKPARDIAVAANLKQLTVVEE